MSFGEEYDYNRVTARTIPRGVNRDPPLENIADEYKLTVGDLCFVALGQIVNRQFTAARVSVDGRFGRQFADEVGITAQGNHRRMERADEATTPFKVDRRFYEGRH